MIHSLVPSPHPQKREKLFGSCWLCMFEFCCTNQSCAMWLTCDYHVIPHISSLLLHACESGWGVALPKWCIVMTVTWWAKCCAPKKALDVYQTLSLRALWGLGTKLSTQLIFFLSLSLMYFSVSYKARIGDRYTAAQKASLDLTKTLYLVAALYYACK